MTISCPKCQTDNPDTKRFCGDCGTQLPSPEKIAVTETIEAPREELTTGSTFAGRYQIIEELGKGGMGRVYKAHDTKIKEKIALKLIKPEIAKDKNTIERFSNELRLARKIRHKNVCGMFDLGEEKGTHYITMEFVPGEDLRSSIRRFGQLPIGKSISIAKQICEGLTEAHRSGVVHRDLKSSNIMIDKEGNVRIMDFGIARSLKGKGITGAGVMIGTPEYMSPEQVEGKETDQRSDIYSLGVILYEMVTGRVPFEGDTALTIAVKHKTEEPKDPREFNTQLSENISRVMLRCLEKDKDKRYQSAGEVRSELTNIEKGIPTTERAIPERKPLTSREITVTFGLKKLFIPAVVFIGIVIIGLVIWQLFPRKEAIPLAQSGKPSLAVMYFENNTGDESLEHWRKGISDLLTTDLTQSKYLRILGSDKLFNILDQLNLVDTKSYSSEDLREVATRGRVNHIVRGNYSRAGDVLRIDLVLQDAKTGEPIASERAEGKGEESVFSMVDELTKKIKSRFILSESEIANDIDKDVGKITTSSPEAYMFHREGIKHDEKGDYRTAIQFYERAVAIDPKFASAYIDMAVAYFNLRLFSEHDRYLQKALELSDRVSERERYICEAEFYSKSERTFAKAIEVFNKLLEVYPEDELGNSDLGWIYWRLEQWDKAIERYELNVKNKTESVTVHFMLALSYMGKGLYDSAQRVLESYLENFPDNASIHRSLAYLYIDQGKYDLAAAELEKAFLLDPTDFYNFLGKGDIDLYQEDLIKAEEEYQKLFKLQEPAASSYGLLSLLNLNLLQGKFDKAKNLCVQGINLSEKLGESRWKSSWHLRSAKANLTTGNYEEAIIECEKAWESAIEVGYLGGQRDSLCTKAHAYIDMGSISEAQKVVDRLKEVIESGLNNNQIRKHNHLMGLIELKEKNFSKAIDYFKDSISLLPYGPLTKRADFIDSLALVYYKTGDLDKAREEYERITSLTTGRLNYGDIYAKSFYMLGKIYEEQGDKAKAIEHYEKFLSLWKDADPGIAEVDDARERRAELKSQKIQ